MKDRPKIRWIVLLSFFLIFSAFAMVTDAKAQLRGKVGTQTCIDCHQNWLDNNPPVEDFISGIVHMDYTPLNLSSTRTGNPFYTIPEGYVSSLHYTPNFNLIEKDHVTCEGCHGSGLAHYGVGAIPTPIPQAKTCGSCHKPPYFEISEFLLTSHANPNKKPGKYFDQSINGTGQAKATLSGGEKVSLVKAGTFSQEGDPVSKNDRIEECSVCHNYALQYPQYRKKIAQGNMPNPEVSCGACHDAHIVAPNGNQPAVVNNTVKVTGISGSTVTAVTPVQGNSVYYLNHKPHKINASGAQDENGAWTRGSAISRPSLPIVKGVGSLSSSSSSYKLTFAGGGFKGNVEELDTAFLSGEASATANLPSDAIDAGKPVTVKVTFDKAGFEVEHVVDDNTLVVAQEPKATVSVTYKKASGTGTLAVPVTFAGSINFEIRNMYTNTEDLCGSCHTQGKHKYTKWGKRADGSLVDLSPTHNKNIAGQYKTSGHADKLALAWAEFSAWEYGSSHQITYPFDMSITGSGGVDSLRNKGFSTFTLTQTPNANNVYLITAGNTTQVPIISNYACNQCHHGLGSIDYQEDRQGTSDAQVLWGDATVTCLTCHYPHKDQNGAGQNVRVPVKLSFNSRFVDSTKNPRGGINKFMDGTDIPSTVGNSIICLFCHQARESGLTVYTAIKGKVDPYTKPDQVIDPAGQSFINPHYLDGGAILWSKNAWEFFFNGVPQKYSTGNSNHQQTNCTGCHMGEASSNDFEGGHTWRPRIETCQTCHSSATNFLSITASVDYDGDGKVKTVYEEIGTINPDTGLFGQMNSALKSKGIYFNPDSYPYFFTSTGAQFRAFTSNTLAASFNVAYAYKAKNAVYVHNPKYIVQILQDSLKALGATPTGVRPSGDRDATDYRTIVVNP